MIDPATNSTHSIERALSSIHVPEILLESQKNAARKVLAHLSKGEWPEANLILFQHQNVSRDDGFFECLGILSSAIRADNLSEEHRRRLMAIGAHGKDSLAALTLAHDDPRRAMRLTRDLLRKEVRFRTGPVIWRYLYCLELLGDSSYPAQFLPKLGPLPDPLDSARRQSLGEKANRQALPSSLHEVAQQVAAR